MIVYNLSIPPGNYSASELISALPALFTATGCGGTYTVSYSSITGKITITSTVIYSLLFGSANSAWYQLGFLNTTYSTALTYTGTFPVNLSPPSYLFLDIENIGLNKCLCSELQNTAGKIPIIMSGVSYTFNNWSSNVNFSLPLSNTSSGNSQWKISLYNANGTLASIQTDWGFTMWLQ